MKKTARATLATLAAVGMTPLVATAEPMVLTPTQMESITAAARPPSINVNVVVQNNITTQIANAIAFAFASCGICSGAPSAFSLATASNINLSNQQVGR
jgi:hypothetical protein